MASEKRRVAAQCRDCGKGYAAEQKASGTISLLGGRDDCLCGSSEFRIVEEST